MLCHPYIIVTLYMLLKVLKSEFFVDLAVVMEHNWNNLDNWKLRWIHMVVERWGKWFLTFFLTNFLDSLIRQNNLTKGDFTYLIIWNKFLENLLKKWSLIATVKSTEEYKPFDDDDDSKATTSISSLTRENHVYYWICYIVHTEYICLCDFPTFLTIADCLYWRFWI